MKKDTKEIILKGINASPGICIGKAYRVDREGVEVVEKYQIQAHDLPKEVNRFESAVKKSRDELLGILEKSPEELQHAHILETHLALLKDKMLYGRCIEMIKQENINAEWALKTVVSNLKDIFETMTDPYLKERSADVVQVADNIMRNLMGAEKVNIAAIKKRVILVAHDLTPAETSQINLERVKGFITDRGGKASHTGIIARSLEIPAVVGLKTATSTIHNDDLIIVDGNTGIVILHPTEDTLVQYEERKINYEEYKAVITREGKAPAESTDGVRLAVMGNIELPEEVFAVISYGGDGIGLYRTEFQYFNRNDFPGEDELFDKYKDVVEVMAPKPVTIRTLDINGDKAVNNRVLSEEANPALGLRAIRYCLKKPQVFMDQLRAILRAAAFGNVRILFPMISTYFELCEANRMLDRAAESLEKDGLPYKRDIQIGAMIEVPSAVIMADVLAQKVDFFSIGTNDLIQYALAIDRGNEQVAHLFQPLDPAIIRMLKHVADVARENDIKVFMCGEMAGTPYHIPLLLGLGIDELSMNPQTIPDIKRVIRALNVADTRSFIKEVLTQTTARSAFKLIKATYGSILSEHVYSE
ncbi:MAG: phosphoenolpyruvate--protein phosphotransferase [Deltaproteobacteria bacterium]|jgi:phosphotransferase system enzyme I (PtsI)|nr:phosphoenolpyruvate--protein phosphotransferase [Deltaproteobacteria bacterium]